MPWDRALSVLMNIMRIKFCRELYKFHVTREVPPNRWNCYNFFFGDMLMHAAGVWPLLLSCHKCLCRFEFDVWTKDFSQRVYVKLKFSIIHVSFGGNINFSLALLPWARTSFFKIMAVQQSDWNWCCILTTNQFILKERNGTKRNETNECFHFWRQINDTDIYLHIRRTLRLLNK